jgi:replicative DNA helicase
MIGGNKNMFEDLFPNEQSKQPSESHEFVPPVEESQNPSVSSYYNNTQKPANLFAHQEQMWDVLDEFEQKAWSATNTGIKTGWQDFDRAFDGGLQPGWIIVGGSSNAGKTSFLSLLGWNITQHNQDVYVMDFSLDDPMQEKIPRVVAAANKVLINSVKTPNNFTQYPDMLKRRRHGIDLLRNSVEQYRVYDANHGSDIDDIETTIKNMIINLEEEAIATGKDRKKVVVMIDNFHDLTTTAQEAMGSDKMKYDYLAQRVKDMSTRYELTIITTGEFKKLNGFRRASVEDLRESIKIVYEASAILICHNEVGIKGESASVYFERQGLPNKQPVFELSFGKNKMSGFKGRLFYEFYPEIAYFEPADKQSTQKYRNLIYSNE